MKRPLMNKNIAARFGDIVANLARKRNRVTLLLAYVAVLNITIIGCRTGVQRKATPKGEAHKAAAQVDKYWQNAKEEVDKSVLEILAQHRTELERGIKYHKFMHGDPTKKQVALTFDDGPHPNYTPKLLKILKQYNTKATFFVVGEMAEKYPGLVRAEIADGHTIGNHTYHHVNLTKIPNEYVATEIKACGEVLKSITGKAPHLFRPPGGDCDKQVAEVAEALGYIIVFWTVNSRDRTKPPAGAIKRRLLNRVSNGGILLLHDGIQQTVDILPEILESLKGNGYELVTIDHMMERK